MTRTFFSFPALVATLAIAAGAAACSSSDGGGGAAAAGSGGGAGSAGAGGSAGSGGGSGDAAGDGPQCSAQAECRTPQAGQPAPAGYVCIKTMDGDLVDPTGAPVAGVTTTCCGKNVCIYGSTDAKGHTHIDVCFYLDTPAYKILGGSRYASFAAPMPAGESVVIWPKSTLFPYPTTGVAFLAGQDQVLESSGASLTVPAAAQVEVNKLDNPDVESRKFRAVEVPIDQAPPAVDATLHLELLWSFAPLDTNITPAAKLTVPNDKAWPAGTAVELFLHGIDLHESVAPYTGWAPIGVGHVSADGTSISTDDGAGNGIPQLSLIGLRRKP